MCLPLFAPQEEPKTLDPAAQRASGYVYGVGKTKAHHLLDASEMSWFYLDNADSISQQQPWVSPSCKCHQKGGLVLPEHKHLAFLINASLSQA